jgi:hypothetical protein
MSSNLRLANNAYRAGDLGRAYSLYEKALLELSHKHFPQVLKDYCESQLIKLHGNSPKQATYLPNVVLSACNAKYFHSLLLFIESLMESTGSTIDLILVLDFGLEAWQSELIKCVKKVKLFSYSSDSETRYPFYSRFDIADASTYFFKVYGFHEGVANAREEIGKKEFNVLWLDVGNLVIKSLQPVFSTIENDGYFFIDHADIQIYYDRPKDRVVNILAPSLFEGELALPLLSEEQLRTPYIKANFFGVKINKESAELLSLHRDICCRTKVLYDPRVITKLTLKTHWQKYYNLNSDDYLYLYGRNEQAAWSYLVAEKEMTIRNSKQFSYTISAGSGTVGADNYRERLKPKIEQNYEVMRDSLMKLLNEQGIDNVQSLKKEQLIDAYLVISEKIYLDEKLFEGIPFPEPKEARKSMVLLHRGCKASTRQFKHAGKLLNYSKNIRDDIFILLGNGPSLADVDLHSLSACHTFGLNAAYRAYERLNFWPKYFGCFDALVCNHHASEFKKLILDSPIEKFFFINFDDSGNEIFTEPEVLKSPSFQRIRFQYREQREKQRTDILSTSFERFVDMRTSGSNTIQAALLLGYRKFILLGVDQNYVEVVDGAKKDNNCHKLIMEKTPQSNPNYWFADYQQKGDKFNRPNLTKSQIPAWNNLSMTLQHLGIKCAIWNCSPITKLEAFPKASLEEAMTTLESTKVTDITSYRSPVQFERFV